MWWCLVFLAGSRGSSGTHRCYWVSERYEMLETHLPAGLVENVTWGGRRFYDCFLFVTRLLSPNSYSHGRGPSKLGVLQQDKCCAEGWAHWEKQQLLLRAGSTAHWKYLLFFSFLQFFKRLCLFVPAPLEGLLALCKEITQLFSWKIILEVILTFFSLVILAFLCYA